MHAHLPHCDAFGRDRGAAGDARLYPNCSSGCNGGISLGHVLNAADPGLPSKACAGLISPRCKDVPKQGCLWVDGPGMYVVMLAGVSWTVPLGRGFWSFWPSRPSEIHARVGVRWRSSAVAVPAWHRVLILGTLSTWQAAIHGRTCGLDIKQDKADFFSAPSRTSGRTHFPVFRVPQAGTPRLPGQTGTDNGAGSCDEPCCTGGPTHSLLCTSFCAPHRRAGQGRGSDRHGRTWLARVERD